MPDIKVWVTDQIRKEEVDRHDQVNKLWVRMTELEKDMVKSSMFRWIIGSIVAAMLLVAGVMRDEARETRTKVEVYQDAVFSEIKDIKVHQATMQANILNLTKQLENLELINQ